MYSKLQNGSDIRGVAMATPEHEVNLTPEAIRNIAAGFVRFLFEREELAGKKQLKIAIGHDSRVTGKALFLDFAAGLAHCDIDIEVIYAGLASTPAMFMATIMPEHDCDASVMITASHMPYDRNGFKFFLKSGGLEKADIKRILEYAAQADAEKTSEPIAFDCRDIMSDYSALLCSIIRDEAGLEDMPLEGLRILVDAGNGAGGFFASKVLAPLGADTAGSLYLEPDGMFPNHIPNPEDANAMAHMTKAVVAQHADLGLVFDTDVDRAAVVLADGSAINRNRLIALMSTIVLEKHPGTTIVTDSVTSTGLAKFITAAGGIHRRFKRGYRNVINESKRLNAAGQSSHLAIETSGHGALMDNYFLDDGAYMACLIVAKAARLARSGCGSLAELLATLDEPAESIERRIAVTDDNFADYARKVLAALEQQIPQWEGFSIDTENCEGLRANADSEHGDGWFLLRLSLHDPVLPLNIESSHEGGCDLIFAKLAEFFSGFDHLNV